MINAYDRDYLYHSQKNFGHMIDFAVNTCDYDIDEFFNMFLASNVCRQFENGNPAYIAGKTGCELARLVVFEVKEEEIEKEDVMYLDKSPEFWLGWVLSYYAWLRNYKFKYIFNAVSAGDMIGMYDTMHEADITKFVYALDERLRRFYRQSNLRRLRAAAGLSQKELSERSGVNIRVIQGYEQRKRDINKAQFQAVLNLAAALGCEPVELVEVISETGYESAGNSMA